MGDEKIIQIQPDFKPQNLGNVWTDRLYSEFPYMKGFEISEEEYQEWKEKEGL